MLNVDKYLLHTYILETQNFIVFTAYTRVPIYEEPSYFKIWILGFGYNRKLL